MQRIEIKAAAVVSAIVALTALGAGAARAQAMDPATTPAEAIPTAAASPDGGAPAMADPATNDTMRLSDHIDRGPDVLRPMGPCGGPLKTADGKTDMTPHGEIHAGVGSRGYREGGGAVCVPLGENAAMSIAVDAGSIDGWRRR